MGGAKRPIRSLCRATIDGRIGIFREAMQRDREEIREYIRRLREPGLDGRTARGFRIQIRNRLFTVRAIRDAIRSMQRWEND